MSEEIKFEEITDIDTAIEYLTNLGWFKEGDNELTEQEKDSIQRCINECTSPSKELIFNAFKGLEPEDVKVLIIGQDPYPEQGRADGMAFSFGNGKIATDSLKNIFEKLKECGVDNGNNTSLEKWRNKEKILLLNTALTYSKNVKKEYSVAAWKIFVDAIIKRLIDTKKEKYPLVVMLWGGYANNLSKFKYVDKLTDEKYFEQHSNIKIFI